ncbi:Uncharacterised protein [Sphingobacterium daejeonense]|nr:Uncharacterised protein [Sphingobacterium daejeonense]
MALVFVAIFISIDMACLRHLRYISCLRHFTPMGLVRRGWCHNLPLKTLQDPPLALDDWATVYYLMSNVLCLLSTVYRLRSISPNQQTYQKQNCRRHYPSQLILKKWNMIQRTNCICAQKVQLFE